MSTSTLGWREWIALPDINIPRIKAKVDTGARTSCLHTFFVESFRRKGVEYVRFGVHPEQKNTEMAAVCEARLLDRRVVSDSGGHKETRCVILTRAIIGARTEHIEITLTNRDSMRFRMLLGRTALQGRYLVDSAGSYLAGDPLEDQAP
jgi:hypothetical protein